MTIDRKIRILFISIRYVRPHILPLFYTDTCGSFLLPNQKGTNKKENRDSLAIELNYTIQDDRRLNIMHIVIIRS